MSFQPEQIPAHWQAGRSFVLALRAANKSGATVDAYGQGVRQLATHFEDRGRMATEITREDTEEFIADQLSRHRPATALTRFKAIKAFFAWMVREGKLERSPMEGLKPPTVPDRPSEPLSELDTAKLLGACQGPGFNDRRDTAIIRFLIDTGCRRGEVAGLLVTDINLYQGVARVTGKRIVSFDHGVARDLDRYLRMRARHPWRDSPKLWIGLRGPLGGPGILAMLKARGDQAGGERAWRIRLLRQGEAA